MIESAMQMYLASEKGDIKVENGPIGKELTLEGDGFILELINKERRRVKGGELITVGLIDMYVKEGGKYKATIEPFDTGIIYGVDQKLYLDVFQKAVSDLDLDDSFRRDALQAVDHDKAISHDEDKLYSSIQKKLEV
jgi:hypothetical protein